MDKQKAQNSVIKEAVKRVVADDHSSSTWSKPSLIPIKAGDEVISQVKSSSKGRKGEYETYKSSESSEEESKSMCSKTEQIIKKQLDLTSQADIEPISEEEEKDQHLTTQNEEETFEETSEEFDTTETTTEVVPDSSSFFKQQQRQVSVSPTYQQRKIEAGIPERRMSRLIQMQQIRTNMSPSNRLKSVNSMKPKMKHDWGTHEITSLKSGRSRVSRVSGIAGGGSKGANKVKSIINQSPIHSPKKESPFVKRMSTSITPNMLTNLFQTQGRRKSNTLRTKQENFYFFKVQQVKALTEMQSLEALRLEAIKKREYKNSIIDSLPVEEQEELATLNSVSMDNYLFLIDGEMPIVDEITMFKFAQEFMEVIDNEMEIKLMKLDLIWQCNKNEDEKNMMCEDGEDVVDINVNPEFFIDIYNDCKQDWVDQGIPPPSKIMLSDGSHRGQALLSYGYEGANYSFGIQDCVNKVQMDSEDEGEDVMVSEDEMFEGEESEMSSGGYGRGFTYNDNLRGIQLNGVQIKSEIGSFHTDMESDPEDISDSNIILQLNTNPTHLQLRQATGLQASRKNLQPLQLNLESISSKATLQKAKRRQEQTMQKSIMIDMIEAYQESSMFQRLKTLNFVTEEILLAKQDLIYFNSMMSAIAENDQMMQQHYKIIEEDENPFSDTGQSKIYAEKPQVSLDDMSVATIANFNGMYKIEYILGWRLANGFRKIILGLRHRPSFILMNDDRKQSWEVIGQIKKNSEAIHEFILDHKIKNTNRVRSKKSSNTLKSQSSCFSPDSVKTSTKSFGCNSNKSPTHTNTTNNSKKRRFRLGSDSYIKQSQTDAHPDINQLVPYSQQDSAKFKLALAQLQDNGTPLLKKSDINNTTMSIPQFILKGSVFYNEKYMANESPKQVITFNSQFQRTNTGDDINFEDSLFNGAFYPDFNMDVINNIRQIRDRKVKKVQNTKSVFQRKDTVFTFKQFSQSFMQRVMLLQHSSKIAHEHQCQSTYTPPAYTHIRYPSIEFKEYLQDDIVTQCTKRHLNEMRHYIFFHGFIRPEAKQGYHKHPLYNNPEHSLIKHFLYHRQWIEPKLLEFDRINVSHHVYSIKSLYGFTIPAKSNMTEIFSTEEEIKQFEPNIYKDEKQDTKRTDSKSLKNFFHKWIPIYDAAACFKDLQFLLSGLRTKESDFKKVQLRPTLTMSAGELQNIDVSEIRLLRKGESLLFVTRTIETVDLPKFKKETEEGMVEGIIREKFGYSCIIKKDCGQVFELFQAVEITKQQLEHKVQTRQQKKDNSGQSISAIIEVSEASSSSFTGESSPCFAKSPRHFKRPSKLNFDHLKPQMFSRGSCRSTSQELSPCSIQTANFMQVKPRRSKSANEVSKFCQVPLDEGSEYSESIVSQISNLTNNSDFRQRMKQRTSKLDGIYYFQDEQDQQICTIDINYKTIKNRHEPRDIELNVIRSPKKARVYKPKPVKYEIDSASVSSSYLSEHNSQETSMQTSQQSNRVEEMLSQVTIDKFKHHESRLAHHKTIKGGAPGRQLNNKSIIQLLRQSTRQISQTTSAQTKLPNDQWQKQVNNAMHGQAEKIGNRNEMYYKHLVKLIQEGNYDYFHVDLEQEDEEGNTLLNMACQYNAVSIVEKLVDIGSDVHTRNKAGKSPFFYAYSNGYFKVLDILLENGVNEKEEMKDKRLVGKYEIPFKS